MEEFALYARDKLHAQQVKVMVPDSMEDVLNGILESLAGADLETIGNHRGHDNNLTKNHDRLKCSATSSEA